MGNAEKIAVIRSLCNPDSLVREVGVNEAWYIVNDILRANGWDFIIDSLHFCAEFESPRVVEVAVDNDSFSDHMYDALRNYVSRDMLYSINQKEPNVAIKKATYVFGKDTATMSVDDFMKAIRRIDDDIKHFTDAGIESSVVNEKVATLKEERAEIVALLDATHGTATAED